MSNFNEKGLNAWRLTKHDSRLFPPDSLKFHSFVVEAGSKLRCGRKGSPQVRKSRQPAGEAKATRRLTYCGCHVENVDIASAVRFCSDDANCIPDCGCRLGESSDGTVGSPAFGPKGNCQEHHIRCAMKRRASSIPRPRKVAKVSVQHTTVIQKRNFVNTNGVSRLQPSVIKNSDVAIPEDSPPSHLSKQKTGKGKLPAEQLRLVKKLSVPLQRLPPEIVKCYLSRPTVVLSRLPDRLLRCREVSSYQQAPVTSADIPEKRFKAEPKADDLERRNTRTSDLSTIGRVKSHNAESVNADTNNKSAREDTPVTSENKSGQHSKSEPRPEDLERQKKSSNDLRAVDKIKGSIADLANADGNRWSAQKEAPVTSASESRIRSKSEPRPDDLEKRKRSSSDLRAEDKVKSRSTNSVHADVYRKSAQKVTHQAVPHQSSLSPASNLRSKTTKLERLLMTRNLRGDGGAKVVSSRSTNAGTYKAEEQTKRKRSTTAEVLVNGAQKEVKSNLTSAAAGKLEEQVSCHPVRHHSITSASAVSNNLQLKSPSKTGGLFAEGRNYFPLLKVNRLPELTNNNRCTDTVDESVQGICSPASDDMLQKDSETTPDAKSLKRKRGRQRHDETGSGYFVERPEDHNVDGVTIGDETLALEICSPENSKTTPDDKPVKRKRGRPKRDETGSVRSVERPEDRKEDGVATGDKNSTVEIHPLASADILQIHSKTITDDKPLKRKRGRPRRDETGSGRSVEKLEDCNEDRITIGDKNSTLEQTPVTSAAVPGKPLKPGQKPEDLERKKMRRSDVSTLDRVKSRNTGTVNADSTNMSVQEEAPVTSASESQTRSKSEPRPEGLEKRKRSSSGLRMEDKIKSPSTNVVHADDDRTKTPKKRSHPSQESSKSASKLGDLGRRKSQNSDHKAATGVTMNSAEDRVGSKVYTGDKKSAQERAPVTSAWVPGKRFKPDQKPEDLERRSTRTNGLSILDHVKSRNTETVNTNSSDKSTHKDPSVTSERESRQHSKSETRPEDLDKHKKSSNDLRTVDKIKSSSAKSLGADDDRKLAQKEASVTSENDSRRCSKSEPRPEGLEKRKRSSSGLRTGDKDKSPSTNSIHAGDDRTSAQKETPVTSASESRRRSKSEPRAEAMEKRKSSNSDVRTVDEVRSPSTNSVNADGNRKSAQKETPVTSPSSESRRRSKSEPRPETLEKRKHGSSDLRTVDKVRSPSRNSVSADIIRKSTQKETPVTSPSESRRCSKSEPSPETLEKRKHSSSDLRTVNKVRSPSRNSVSAEIIRKSAKKESPVTSPSESRRRSKSEPRAETLEKRKNSSGDLRTVDKVRSPSRNSVSAEIIRKSTQKETPVISPNESRRRSKSEPRPETLEKRKNSSSDLRTVDKVRSPSRNSVSAEIIRKSAKKETSLDSGSESRKRSKSATRPEEMERRNRWSSDLRTVDCVKSPSTDMVPADDKRKMAQTPSSVSSRSSSRDERQKKRRERNNEFQTQITMLNGDEENNGVPVIGAIKKSTQKNLPKAAAHADISVHSKENELHHPDQAARQLNKIPSKLERLKAKRYQNPYLNRHRDVTSTLPNGGDSDVKTTQKMLESLAPSPSCRSMRSILSESLTSLNSLSSEGTEIESPAYEPLGSSPVFMQNLRDDHEEIQKAKVISPSCRSDCCSLRQSQGSASSPLKMQIQNKAAVRRLSEIFDALPSTAEGGTENRQTPEEQRLKCLTPAVEDGNLTPCHEVDHSFYEEWAKSVREADQMAKAGFVPKYSKKIKGHEATFDGVPNPSDRGKELILPQKLSSTSPTNWKQHDIALNKQALLGWEPLRSPPDCDPSRKTDETVLLDVNDSETSDSEEDCIITDIRPRSSLSSVFHKTPALGLREDSRNSTKVTERSNLGKSLIDLRPEQQIDTSNELTVVRVSCTSSPRKWQHCNKSLFQSSKFSSCRRRPKSLLRRCRSASPRLCHVSDYSGSYDNDDDDDDDECIPCDVDPTVSRLQQINKRIELLENSTLQMNPLWRHKKKINASYLEESGVSKLEMVGDKEDTGDDNDDDDDESVIVLDEPNRRFNPKSPSYSPPDRAAEKSSLVQCGSLTIENVNKHNRFLESSHSSQSPSSSLSLCDSDDGDSFHSVTRDTLTPRRTPHQESSFTDVSTPGMNGVCDCLSPVSQCRSRCSSRNEDISKIDLPSCSATKTQNIIKPRSAAEMIYLFASPSSYVSDEVSPILNRRRYPAHKGGENSVKHNGTPHSVSKTPEVSVQGHSSQLVTPDLSIAGTDSVFCHTSDDVQEIEYCLSQESDVSRMYEEEQGRRNLKTPTELYNRRLSSLSPAKSPCSPPYSPGEQSSVCSIERRHSASSMEKSMLLHLFDEMRSVPPLDDGITREGDDVASAGNDSICVDGSHSSGESDDLDARRKDTVAEVVAEGFGLQITRGDLATLSGTNWLNDKIVNFYLKLLTERGRQNREPEVYAYDTFFFPKLIKCGYQSVKKWTRVVDVFKHDILIIPVHLGTHWCMAAVDFRKQTLVYYDSMGGENESCLKTIWNYLHQECVQRSVEPLSEEIWQLQCAKDIPKQSNNSDCGVFMCKYAECITRDAKLEFSQSDMPEIRMEMMEEIRSMTLLH